MNSRNDKDTSGNKKSQKHKKQKNSYDRIKLGKMRWRKGKKDNNYADINSFNNNGLMRNDTKDHVIEDTKRQSTHTYENPDDFILQSYETVPSVLSRDSTVKPSATAEETVMVENTEVYESVDSHV